MYFWYCTICCWLYRSSSVIPAGMGSATRKGGKGELWNSRRRERQKEREVKDVPFPKGNSGASRGWEAIVRKGRRREKRKGREGGAGGLGEGRSRPSHELLKSLLFFDEDSPNSNNLFWTRKGCLTLLYTRGRLLMSSNPSHSFGGFQQSHRTFQPLSFVRAQHVHSSYTRPPPLPISSPRGR